MASKRKQEKEKQEDIDNIQEQEIEIGNCENCINEESGTEPQEDITAKVAELQDKYLRLSAEFDNYRKRTLKERADLIRTAGKEVIKELLPVVDDFDRAVEAIDSTSNLEALKEGVMLILEKLQNILKQRGLQGIDAIGEEFNSEIHEAIAKVPVDEKNSKGKIIDQVQKGYMLNDEVIRFPKVIVGE